MLKSDWRRLALLGMLPFLAAACQNVVPELKPDELAELNKPGTVMVQATHRAEIAVPDYQLDQGKFEALLQETSRRVKRGLIASPEQGLANVVQEIFTQPLKYFKPTQDLIQQKAQVTSQGSGFIVSEDGYVVTNAHVVSGEGESLKTELAKEALKEIATANCKAFMADINSEYRQMLAQTIGTEELIKLCLDGSFTYYANYLKVGEIDTNVRTLLSTANAQSEKEGYVSEIKAMGKAVPGKDVAVLKIEADNLPTVVLGKADAIGTGDATYALGYPAIATLDDSKPIEATFTSGVISAKKTMPDGWSVLQTDTTISHGSSGGPVFNPDGKVIGVATFGSVDPQTGEAVQGINFVVPINIVEEFLDQANVEPGEGRLSQLYREGIQLEAQERYHAALKKFQEVEDLNAQFPYIQQQISKTRKATVDHPESKLPLVLGVVSGGLSASGAAFLLVRRLRRFRTQQKAVPHS